MEKYRLRDGNRWTLKETKKEQAVIMIKNTVYGNRWYKKVYLRRLERLYGLQISSNQLCQMNCLLNCYFGHTS